MCATRIEFVHAFRARAFSSIELAAQRTAKSEQLNIRSNVVGGDFIPIYTKRE